MNKRRPLDDIQLQKSIESINKAIKVIGSQYRVARNIGVKDPVVTGWIKGRILISPRDAIKLIESLKQYPKKYKINLHDLRPDIFPKGSKLVIED